jgi:hypothetical protein
MSDASSNPSDASSNPGDASSNPSDAGSMFDAAIDATDGG